MNNSTNFITTTMAYTVGKIAQLIGGSVKGDSSIRITGAAKLDQATAGEITFLSSEKYIPSTEQTSASAILLHKKYAEIKFNIPTICVDNVYTALAELLTLFQRDEDKDPGISQMAFVHPTSKIDATAHISPFSIIEEGVEIGPGSKILGQVFLGQNVKIGRDCIIYPGVKIYKDCILGDECILHANVVIGSDGFGFAPEGEGTFVKIPQIGNVVLEDKVEIGANTVVDRATMGSTIIKRGVKLDNLIQVAHNVEIGENTVIAAQAGIAGSTKIGPQSQIGGQVGIVGHLNLAERTLIQAQSGVTKSTKKPGTKLYGSPAIDYNNYLKSFAIYKNLPDLQARIRKLEKLLEELQAASQEPLHEAKDD